MTTFVLLPGAGGMAWNWHRVEPLLAEAGHDVVAVDLPGGDPDTGLADYADLVVDDVGDRDDVTLVALSLGAFTAALVAGRLPVSSITLLNAMVPLDGERPGEWWEATGWDAAFVGDSRRGGRPTTFDPATHFLHDLPPDVVAASADHHREEAAAAFESPCHFGSWPSVPLRAVAGAGDRFFPPDFQRRIARQRLGVDLDVIPGGHLAPLSRPADVAAHLLDGA